MFKEPPDSVTPIPTFFASDVQPMPAGEFVPVTIPLYFEGHAYRAGSRVRVTISAPNGTQPVWSFDDTQPDGTTAHVLGRACPPASHSRSCPASACLRGCRPARASATSPVAPIKRL